MARFDEGSFGFSTNFIMLAFSSRVATPNFVGSSTGFRSIRASIFSLVNFCKKAVNPCPCRLSPRHMMKLSSPKKGFAVLTAWANPKGSWGM